MQMKRIVLTADNPFDEGMLERAGTFEPEVIANVSRIIDDVRKRGDEAVREYTKRFDGLDLDDYRVPEDEIDAAFDAVSEEVVESLELAAEHIRLFHEQQRRQSWFITRDDGAFLGTKVTPIERVGLYVPGGRARYPSTVLMDAIPAKVAGVDRIAMTTPPASDGRIDATTLVAARIAGVDEVYSIGGAQAIAALAYGTASIERVDKIVGPGNIFVAAAKKLVSGDVGIDMIAGPSEVCILASRYCTPEFVAIDLMAQAEHDPQAICYLISSTEELADRIHDDGLEVCGCCDFVHRLLHVLPLSDLHGRASVRGMGSSYSPVRVDEDGRGCGHGHGGLADTRRTVDHHDEILLFLNLGRLSDD